MSEIHATPGGEQAATYQVVEQELQVSRDHIDQVAVVGRSNDGVHLVMTPAAAELLAKILVQHFSAYQQGQLPELDDFDPVLWTHLSVDILTARAMALGASSLGQDVVYATKVGAHFARPLTSTNRTGRRLKIVDVDGGGQS